jgi:hypothetical protein
MPQFVGLSWPPLLGSGARNQLVFEICQSQKITRCREVHAKVIIIAKLRIDKYHKFE